MRVDTEVFKKHNCDKCKNYSGDEPVFGNCVAEKGSIYGCAKLVLFNKEEFIKKTGISNGAF